VKLRGGVSYKLRVEFDRETDGRWIAEVIDLPGARRSAGDNSDR